MTKPPLLEVDGLCKYFPVTQGILGKVVGHVRAVDDVSFQLQAGETLGLVGESGCGKTTTGRSLLRLIEPTHGRVTFHGVDVTALRGEELRAQRRKMQIVFQDPYGSLNPRMRVIDLVGEGMRRHGIATGAQVEPMVEELLEQVGLPKSWTRRYPHEFSGGQRQRIGIARAIAMQPDLVVCDEAVSALDVSIQAQVINLLIELRRRMGLAYLFIAHDLSVVRHISDRVAVMYLGRIVELAPTQELFSRPAHPYTKALLSAIPIADPTRKRQRVVLHGDVPTPLSPPSGCHFHTRCPYVVDRCREESPPLVQLSPGRLSRCIHAEGLEGAGDAAERLEERLRQAHRESESGSGSARDLMPRFRAERAGDPPPTGPSRAPGTNAFEPARSDRDNGALSSVSWVALAGLLGVTGAGLYAWSLIVAVLALPLLLSGNSLRDLSRRRVCVASALLLAVVAVSVPVRRARRVAHAREQLDQIAEQLQAYARNVGQLPPTLEPLRWRLLEKYPARGGRDPWGQRVVYRAQDASSFELRSHGADGQPSDDDLLVQRQLSGSK